MIPDGAAVGPATVVLFAEMDGNPEVAVPRLTVLTDEDVPDEESAGSEEVFADSGLAVLMPVPKGRDPVDTMVELATGTVVFVWTGTVSLPYAVLRFVEGAPPAQYPCHAAITPGAG